MLLRSILLGLFGGRSLSCLLPAGFLFGFDCRGLLLFSILLGLICYHLLLRGFLLGLPLAVGLTELHGGTLTIRSTKGIGTTVTVAFPRERSLP